MSLHIFNKIHEESLEQCISNCTKNDVIIFIEEAATAAQSDTWQQRRFPCPAFQLTSDASTAEPKKAYGIPAIDQRKFVELTTQHNPLVSW